MTLEGTISGRKTCGTIETAVEYIRKNPRDIFIIKNATQAEVEKIRKRVANVIKSK